MVILIPWNVAAPVASDHGFLSELIFLHTFSLGWTNKVKYLRYIGLISPRIIKFQMFVTFSNKYNFDAGIFELFTGYLKKTKNSTFQSNIFTKATVTESTAAVLWRRPAGTPRSAATTQRPLIRLLWPWEMYWENV